MTAPRLRLALAAALLLGWMGWLGYAAVSKSRGPVVSRAAAAAATHPVVALVAAADGDRPGESVEVIQAFRPDGPPPGANVEVLNLSAAEGFTGAGQYLLLLVRQPGGEVYTVAGRQRSPGYDPGGSGRPVVYPWTRDVEAQARALFRGIR